MKPQQQHHYWLRWSHSSINTEVKPWQYHYWDEGTGQHHYWSEATTSLLTEVKLKQHHYWLRWSHISINADVKPWRHHYWLRWRHNSIIPNWGEATGQHYYWGKAIALSLLTAVNPQQHQCWQRWSHEVASLLRWSHSNIITEVKPRAAPLLRGCHSIITDWGETTAISMLTQVKPRGSIIIEVKAQQHHYWGEATSSSIIEMKPQQHYYWQKWYHMSSITD